MKSRFMIFFFFFFKVHDSFTSVSQLMCSEIIDVPQAWFFSLGHFHKDGPSV